MSVENVSGTFNGDFKYGWWIFAAKGHFDVRMDPGAVSLSMNVPFTS